LDNKIELSFGAIMPEKSRSTNQNAVLNAQQDENCETFFKAELHLYLTPKVVYEAYKERLYSLPWMQ